MHWSTNSCHCYHCVVGSTKASQKVDKDKNNDNDNGNDNGNDNDNDTIDTRRR